MPRESKASLESRISALEDEVAKLRQELQMQAKPKEDWLDVVYGAFADDPTFDEVTGIGQEWRESFRPKASKKQKKTNGRPRHRSSHTPAKNQ